MDIMYDWPEMISLAVLIFGFFAALFSGSTIILYAVCLLMGLLFGRTWYRFRKSSSIPLFMAVIAFFFGFILGGFYANLRTIILLLIAGMLLGYWLHKKKIIRSIDF